MFAGFEVVDTSKPVKKPAAKKRATRPKKSPREKLIAKLGYDPADPIEHRWFTRLADTPADIAAAFEFIAAFEKRVVAVDIETNGLDIDDMAVRTVQLGYNHGEGVEAIVLRIERPDGTHDADCAAAVSDGLAAFDVPMVSYGSFDARALAAGLGAVVDIANVMPLHHFVDSTQATREDPLKSAFTQRLSVSSPTDGADTVHCSTGDPVFLEYAALDALGLRALVDLWSADMSAAGWDADQLDTWLARENRLEELGQMMSDHGLLVDADACCARADQLAEQISEAAATVEKYAPGIKPGSRKLIEVFEARGVEVPIVRRKSGGKVSYSKSLGRKYLRSADPLVVAVQAHWQLKSWRGSLVNPPNAERAGGIVHNLDEGGRLHGRFNPLGAVTSRWSSSGPNLQNIPKHLRSLFVPRPGFVFVQADMSQIEYRVAAALSCDLAMVQAYKDGFDFHVYAAQVLSGVEEPTDTQRSEAKAIGFGNIYGASAALGAAKLGITEAEMQARIGAYDAAFPMFKEWREMASAEAANGTTPITPYRRTFKVDAGYMAVNYLCQSTAREVFSDWLLRVAERYAGYLVAVVHDEIVLEVPEAEAAAVLEYVTNCASACSVPGSDIPIKATGAIAPVNWAQAYPD